MNHQKEKYAEILKNPQWQKMRLQIMKRDNFTCRFCGNNQRELQVHHTLYYKGFKPWEYPERYYITLCSTCHNKETSHRWTADKELSAALAQIGLSFSDIALLKDAIFEERAEIIAYLRDKVFNRYTPEKK